MSKAVSDDDGDRCKRERMTCSVGKGDDADDGDERVAMDCGASTSGGVAKDILEVPKSPDLLGEDNGRNHKLEAKHKIFLSHSGSQKSFVADLCDDLIRCDQYPFFDKLRDSLPVGEKFPDLIFEAIHHCEVGVLVLSEEFFTRSKWPMLELAAMVEENKRRKINKRTPIRIIPVYYDIDRDVVCKTAIDEWMKVWREWEERDRERIVGKRINVEEWKIALEECCGPTLGLRKREGMLDNRFRAQIVEAVCNRVRSEARWDDLHVKGKTRLVTEICQRIYKGARPGDLKVGVHVVGLYGMGGAGKTTACKMLCSELSREYHDKVCHVEFRSANKEEEVLQMVLRKLSDLTDLEVEDLENMNVDECHGYLKTHLHKDRVFLALDNVSDESDKQAESLVGANFGNGSVVLVTARSMDQLQRVGVKEENCFGMPELELEEAKSVLLDSGHLKENEVGEEFVKTCLRRCYFFISSGRKHYHPLALKVLGREVGAMIRGGKDERAVLSRIGDFNMSRRENHPIFSILGSSFDSMLEEDQLLFLYIALDIVVDVGIMGYSICTAMEWLCMVQGKDRDEVKDMLEGLKRRSLLDSFAEDKYGDWEFHVHDLWREFAKEEMRAGRFGDGRRVYESEWSLWMQLEGLIRGVGYVWHNFLEEEMRVGRFGEGRRVYDGEVCRGRVDLREYPKLEAVKLRCNGEDVVAVDVRGLEHLKSLDFMIRAGITKEVIGLGTLKRLVYLVLRNADSAKSIADLRLLTNLRLVNLSYFQGDSLPDMSTLSSLEVLVLANSRSLKCINLRKLSKLSKLFLLGCNALQSVDVSECRRLKNLHFGVYTVLPDNLVIFGCHYELEELNLSFCTSISSLGILQWLIKLRKLNITGCSSIESIDELRYLEALEELRARDCGRLAMLPECRLPNLRVLDIESVKVPTVFGKEKGFAMLELEHFQAKALFSRADLTQNDEGEEFVTTSLPTGQSLSFDGKEDLRLPLKVSGSEEFGSAVDEGQAYTNLSTSSDNSIQDALYNELQQIDKISEVQCYYKDLQSLFQDGDGITIFCCYDSTNSHFEFYFKNSEEMASVVGVGMEYAKVILVGGWKVTIQELSEVSWKQTLGRVQSSSTIIYKSLKLLQNQSVATMNNEFERYPLLWTIAKYFTLKEALTKLTMTTNNDASTSKGSRGESSMLVNGVVSGMGVGFSTVPVFRGSKGKEGGDITGSGTVPTDVKDPDCISPTKVSIEFLAGGEIASGLFKNKKGVKDNFDCPPKLEELEPLERQIKPVLEISFLIEEDGVKKIKCTVGTINFNLDGADNWLHDEWKVIFGLYGANQRYAKVAHGTSKALDVATSKSLWNDTHSSGGFATDTLNGTLTGGGGYSRPGGGVDGTGSLALNCSRSRTENDTQQSTFGGEGPISITEGGLEFASLRHRDEKQLAYKYFNRAGAFYFVDDSKRYASHMNQDVKFQGTFTILVSSPDFVEYKLTASRHLKEIEQKFKSCVLKRSGNGSRQDPKEFKDRLRRTDDEIIFTQICEKAILINHSMTQLDGKWHKLAEAMQGSDATFTKENGMKYEWPNDPLVKPSPRVGSPTSSSENSAFNNGTSAPEAPNTPALDVSINIGTSAADARNTSASDLTTSN